MLAADAGRLLGLRPVSRRLEKRLWEGIRHHLVVMPREGEGRDASPGAAIIDAQSVETTGRGGLAAGTRRSG